MGSQKHCLRQAKECDRLAAEAKLKPDREVLRSAAAMWRRLAAAYELFKGDAIIKFGSLCRGLDKASGTRTDKQPLPHARNRLNAEDGISTNTARRPAIRLPLSPHR